jgi:menaquinone-specific isochorismate synthase
LPESNTTVFSTSAHVIQVFLERESGSIIRWVSPSDNVQWLGVGVAERFSNASDAVATIKRMTELSPEYKGEIRCFVALPCNTNLWDQNKNWVLPRLVLKKSNDKWEGIEILSGEKPEDDHLIHDIYPTQLIDGSNIDSINAGENRQSLNPLLVTKLPTPQIWCNQVDQIKKHIADKFIQKAVLSRQEYWKTEKNNLYHQVFENMCQNDNDCFQFQFPTKSGSFIGASPETLFRLEGRTISVDSLAGTRGRSADSTKDKLLCSELINSKKDIGEHAIVTKSILKRLKLLCKRVENPTELTVKKFNSVQHLFRRVTGELHSGIMVDEILMALHPTPAIVGEPRSESYKILKQIGEPERGLYAGPVGWVDDENAEFAVGIRSAIIEEKKFTLFAGAGIVKDSDPQSEWEETTLKMQVMWNNIVGVQNDPA